MRIGALFTDYDGTLAPQSVTREDSKVPFGIASRLTALSRAIPVAVITSKDVGFVRPRTAFARGWAGSAGIEIALADGRTYAPGEVPDLRATFERIRGSLPDGVLFEEKRSTDGRLIGICVDWTKTAIPDRLVVALATRLGGEGAHVERPPGCTYLDAFAAPPDKGLALSRMRDLLGVRGKVMYLGDSPLDNNAFNASDVSVGIDHGQPTDMLHCDYLIGYDSLERFLQLLLDNDLEFSADSVRAL